MIKTLTIAAALAGLTMSASAATITGGAPASFFDFTTPSGHVDAPSFTFDVNGTDVTATGTVFGKSTAVRRTASGLGVNGGKFDLEKDEVGASEKLALTFGRTFNLASIVIDDLTMGKFKTDAGTVTLLQGGSVVETVGFDAGAAIGELLTIGFAGGALVDSLHFEIANGSFLSAQNFALRGISEVPVPAALPLLASALGGLAWIRRRRQAA